MNARTLPDPWRDLTLLAVFVALVCAMAWHAQVVRGAPAAPSLGACDHAQDRRRTECVRTVLRERLHASPSVPAALRVVNAQARRDPWLARRCHAILHEVGRTWDGVLRPGEVRHDGKDCAAGFLHGWLLANLDGVDRAAVTAWCAGARTELERADCEHGMGHVLVRGGGGDLPAALRRCAALGDGAFERNCASGAFMENRFGGKGTDDAASTAHWRAGAPWQPCTVAPRRLLDVCAAWAVRDVAPERRVAWCERLPATIDPTACRVAVGSIAPSTRSGRLTCGGSADCWYGRGFAWAMLGWRQARHEDAARRCLEAPDRRMRAACAAGVGFRRGASVPDPVGRAAMSACTDLFSGGELVACRAGVARRGEPIAYA